MTMFKISRLRFFVSMATVLSSIAPLSGTRLLAGEISGFTEPYRDVDVAGSEMGVLHYLHVKEGGRVSQGQVIGGLDESVLQAALEVARRAMEARGRLRSAEADLALKVDRAAKLSELLQRRHASVEEQARAESQKQIAEAQVHAVREELGIKTAEFARIEAQLKQKRIVAPIDGIVSQIFKDPGEFISASDPVVVKIVQLDVLCAEFPVPAAASNQFTVGTSVPLIIGRKRSNIEGHVEFVSPTTDAQSNTVRIKIRIDNEDGHHSCGERCLLAIDVTSDETGWKSQHFTNAKHNRSRSVQ